MCPRQAGQRVPVPARRCLPAVPAGGCSPRCHPVVPSAPPAPSLPQQGALQGCLAQWLMPGVVLARGGRRGCQAALAMSRIAAWKSPLCFAPGAAFRADQAFGLMGAAELLGKLPMGIGHLGRYLSWFVLVFFFFHSLYLLNLLKTFHLRE